MDMFSQKMIRTVFSHLIHEVPLHYITVGLRCAMNAKLIIGLIFYTDTINSDRYVRLILAELFAQFTEEELLYVWFQQDSATVHTADDSLTALEGVFGDRKTSCNL
jgi:hypothetical protein